MDSPTTTSTPIPTPQLPFTPTRKSLLPTFLIVLLLLAPTAIGLLAYQNWQLKQQLTRVLPTPTPSAPSALPSQNRQESNGKTDDPTKTWKTYENTTYNFSFRYPPSWKELSTEADKTRGNPGYINRNVTIETDKKEIVSATVFDGKADKSTDNESTFTFDIGNNKSVLISYAQCSGPECFAGKQDLNTFDQILSTFRFLEVNATPTPTTSNLQSAIGWQKVENSTFSIKYPADKFTVKNADKFIQLTRVGQTNPGPDFLLFTNVSSSAQNWYLNYYSYSPSEIGTNIFFKQKRLGSFEALEVSTKTSPNYIQDIVVTKGSNLVDLHTQDSDLALMETLISTLVFK